MLDEENDRIIKEAADHYHPEYDDTAWEKMEQLLDEHLPVEKERKRIFFLRPLALLIGCLLLLIGLYYWKNTKPEASQNLASKNKAEQVKVTNPPNKSKEINSQLSLETEKNPVTITKGTNKIGKDHIKSASNKSEKAFATSSFGNHDDPNVVPAFGNDLVKKKNDLPNQQAIEKTDHSGAINHEKNSISENTNQGNKSNVTADTKENKVDGKKSVPEKEMIGENNIGKTENVPSKNPGKKPKKTSGGFGNNFGLSISAGPDVSDVYHNKIGKLTLAYGAGASYAISKKLNLRTGFYLSKKIYSVDREDYNLPPGSVGNYQYLQNVNANCKVYEIPLKLDYSFGKTKNHNWFVSGGLSSYLMKKETYNYYYKTPSGQIYNKDWSISNKNRHFFSVLDISGGYQYFLNQQFSMTAEPYVNLPLTGIGAGKVKLNSGGILFTIKVKPFLRH
jgi:hypothetical protein